MGEKTVSLNRKATHDFHVIKTVEAGLSLLGTEIKSIRDGRVSIREAYVRPKGGELWLVGAHISMYPPAGIRNHEPLRDRKLLLHKKEIRELAYDVEAQGVTLVPLRLYLKDGKAKLEVALAKGKRKYDKRQDLAKKDAERQMQRAMRSRG